MLTMTHQFCCAVASVESRLSYEAYTEPLMLMLLLLFPPKILVLVVLNDAKVPVEATVLVVLKGPSVADTDDAR